MRPEEALRHARSSRRIRCAEPSVDAAPLRRRAHPLFHDDRRRQRRQPVDGLARIEERAVRQRARLAAEHDLERQRSVGRRRSPHALVPLGPQRNGGHLPRDTRVDRCVVRRCVARRKRRSGDHQRESALFSARPRASSGSSPIAPGTTAATTSTWPSGAGMTFGAPTTVPELSSLSQRLPTAAERGRAHDPLRFRSPRRNRQARSVDREARERRATSSARRRRSASSTRPNGRSGRVAQRRWLSHLVLERSRDGRHRAAALLRAAPEVSQGFGPASAPPSPPSAPASLSFQSTMPASACTSPSAVTAAAGLDRCDALRADGSCALLDDRELRLRARSSRPGSCSGVRVAALVPSLATGRARPRARGMSLSRRPTRGLRDARDRDARTRSGRPSAPLR